MVKKKIAILFGIIALIAIISSGTITYFTAEGSATNVITSGRIVIDLVEKSKGVDGVEIPFEDVVGVVPGTSYSKIVSVKNDGDSDSYVRISLKNTVEMADGSKVDATGSADFTFDFNNEKWTYKDGYWYYNDPLKPGAETEPLFTSVAFGSGIGNEYKNSKLTVSVIADAAQVRNNGTSALEAEYPKGGES